MSKICYVPKSFSRQHTSVINRANAIMAEYRDGGYPTPTLRQIYYAFVGNAWIPNTVQAYHRLGGIIADGRLAGKIDWESIQDRTRNLQSLQHFEGPQDALEKLSGWYHVDMWENQKFRPEVHIEKDALVGMIHGACVDNDVPYFSCRGYTSLSEMWVSSMRLRRHLDSDQQPYIIHFGDHDPSGIDMSRDITERLRKTFMADCEFQRVALNMDQVQELKLPPNPAKVSDPRATAYIAKFGHESWELDALRPPGKFRELIEEQLQGLRDEKQWDIDLALKAKVKKQLTEIAVDWEGMTSARKDLGKVRKELELSHTEIAELKKKINGKKKK